MKPQLNSRLIRLISVILVIFTLAFLFNYLLDLEQQNTLKKEQEEDTARLLVIQAKEQEKLVLAELEKQAENERVLKILESRSVLEPGNKILGERRWNLTLIKGFFFYKNRIEC
jgi:cell division protein FtsI/penicillin-binding protein 2